MQLTLDQLCRGVGNPRIADTIKNNQQTKIGHHYANKGFSKGKELRHVAEIPMWCKFHPELSKYFDNDMDAYERKKNLHAFLKKYGGGYMVVEKL